MTQKKGVLTDRSICVLILVVDDVRNVSETWKGRNTIMNPTTKSPALHHTLSTLFSELVEGAAHDAAWMLNRGDLGLLRSLDRLSAADASRVPTSGGSSIAAHVDHLRYGLSLFNRWSLDESPFASADYSASWRRVIVTDEEWSALREQLREETRKWLHVLSQPRDLTEGELKDVVASIPHLAYHLGAIRQIDRSIRGPAAID